MPSAAWRWKCFALRKVDDGGNVERSDVLWDMYKGSLLANGPVGFQIGVGRIDIQTGYAPQSSSRCSHIHPIASRMNSVRSPYSLYFSWEPWLGSKKGKDPGWDRARHDASKSQDLEAVGYRGVPIIVPLKDRPEGCSRTSVTFVAVWKAKRP